MACAIRVDAHQIVTSIMLISKGMLSRGPLKSPNVPVGTIENTSPLAIHLGTAAGVVAALA